MQNRNIDGKNVYEILEKGIVYMRTALNLFPGQSPLAAF
jgi:hypothetical protein